MRTFYQYVTKEGVKNIPYITQKDWEYNPYIILIVFENIPYITQKGLENISSIT